MKNWKRSTIAIAATLLVGPGIFNSTNVFGQEPNVAFESVQSKSNDAPAVLIRPSVTDLKHINECVVEINEIPDSNSKIALRLLVPDSVQRIEVIPNRSTSATRNFRLQLDQGAPLEPIYYDNTPESPVISNQSARTQPTSSTSAGQKFKKNPYMQQRVAQVPKSHTASNRSNAANRMMLQPVFYSDVDLSKTPNMIRTDSTGPNDLSSTKLAHAEQTISETPVVPATDFLPPIVAGAETRLIATQLIGPMTMGVGDIGDFTIVVANPTQRTWNDMEVTLTIPEGLAVVIIDREAKMDRDANTLTWSIGSSEAREETLIRYRVQSETQGSKPQQISLSVGGKSMETCELTTDVRLGYSTTEAPSLQYESETK